MKNPLPFNIITLRIIIVAGLLTLVCPGFVPRVVASDTPAAAAGLSLDAREVEQVLRNAPATALPNGNTKDGILALQNLTSGSWNSAFVAAALYSDTTGSINTAEGVGAM